MKYYATTLLALLVLCVLGVQPVAAAGLSPAPSDPTHPIVMQDTARRVATAQTAPLAPFAPVAPQAAVGGGGGLQHEIFGFGLASSLNDPTFGYPSWDFTLLSTVAFFGLHVQDDGTFAADSGWNVWNSSQLTGLLNVAHANRTKVVVTIILQDFAANTPHMCAGLAHVATTVTNTVAEMKAKGVDGVNLDYEGLNGSCGSADSSWARHSFTNFAANLRTALGPVPYLSVDTYASSASDPLGYFDIPGLGASVDSFFVMAYDLEYSNYARAPLYCSSFCLGPTAPLAGYYYNDTSTASQYMAAVPASKVILGVPYYGRKACVAGATPNQYPTGAVTADTYLDASTEATVPGAGFVPGSYVTHRDANDPAGQGRWDTWQNTSLNCKRELYWDDTVALGAKYDLVNADNLRGVGIWNLNYGGGASELWRLLAVKFAPTPVWTSLGGTLTSGPGVSSWSASRTDVFVRSSDNAMWQSAWNGSAWSAWTSLGGSLTSDPAAVSWGPNRVDVFARSTDNQMWHKFGLGGGVWSGWEPLGGVLTSGPGVASWGAGRLDVFVRGTDNQLWHKFYSGGWSGWEPLGGVLTSDPTAVSWGSGRIDIFVRGTDNQIWHMFWGGGWSGWEPLGGVLMSAPAASSCGPGQLDVFATGSGSALVQLGFNGAWGTWRGLGGQWTSKPGAVCVARATGVSVFERGTDNALWLSSVPAS